MNINPYQQSQKDSAGSLNFSGLKFVHKFPGIDPEEALIV